MSNRIHLAQLLEMKKEAIATIPLDQIEMLLEDVSDMQTKAKGFALILSTEMNRRFLDEAAANRRMAGKDTGTVRLSNSGYTVIADLPKKVEWDQKKLVAAVTVIEKEWEENPSDYVDIKITVSENKFKAWPPKIKAVFEPARIVSTGTPTFKLEAPKAEAA